MAADDLTAVLQRQDDVMIMKLLSGPGAARRVSRCDIISSSETATPSTGRELCCSRPPGGGLRHWRL